MESVASFDRKGNENSDVKIIVRKSRNEFSLEKNENNAGGGGGGSNRSGKRYQNSRTISKRKDSQKHSNESSSVSLYSQELNKQLQANLPEDMRISKLLRRLCQETDAKVCLDLCNKLGLVILEQCNAVYIRKSFDILADGIMSVLENGPAECCDAAADVFGMMGFVARADFGSYRAWIMKYYKYSKKLKRAMMKALKKTLLMDVNGELRDYAPRLMEMLKDFLEAADTVETFIVVTDVVVEVCTRYPNCFKKHFTDIVDIVVGWHLETDQNPEVKGHCSKVLQSFKVFWNEDLEFTLSLLGQFVEDIGVCYEDLQTLEGGSDELQNSSAISFSSLLDAFNTVMKCLFVSPEGLLQSVGKEMVDSNFQLVVKVSKAVVRQPCPEEVLLPVNESLILLLLLESSANTVGSESILPIIRAQIEILDELNQRQITSLLLLLCRYVECYAANLRSEFLLMIWDRKYPFIKLRYRQSREIQEGLLKLYHRVLAIKNVNVLQEAYKYILDDLDNAMKTIHESVADNGIVNSQAQFAINFNLLTLSPLAMANNSILVMWTLQPSILVVLLDKLHILNTDLCMKYEKLHYAIIRVAYQHCIQNSNFISSSSLLRSKNYAILDSFNRMGLESTPVSTTSPTAEHFRFIIEFLEKILPEDSSIHHVELLLDWCRTIIGQAAHYFDVLLDNRSFNAIIRSICDISVRPDEGLILRCAKCLDLVSSYKSLAANTYQSIAEVCCVHMCSVSSEVREIFSSILGKLPLRFSLKQVSQFSGNNQLRSQHIYGLQHWYVSTEKTGDMRSQYFREFIERIGFQQDTECIDDFLKEMFVKSWFANNDKSRVYAEMALNDLRSLVPWVQWEAAHFCVNNKLRTPIGKPQETFLKIESVIKQNARVLALKESGTVKNLGVSMANQRHARILLGFLEALEKAIYNAAEGTAFALPSPEKPARTFFRVNFSTCAEWFNRVRTAVDLVALHCMEPEMVIRYSEAVLKELVLANKINDPIFEHTLMSLVWALLRNWENDALYGVYVWTKRVTGRKYLWIKMAAEEAAGHRETAVEGFMSILRDPECANLDRHIRDFIVDQTTLSLIFTERLTELHDFLISEETSGIQRATVPLLSFTSNQVKSWMEYDRTRDKNAIDMSSWETADMGSGIANNFSCHKIICATENSIGATFLQNDTAEKERTLRVCNEVIHSALQECLLTKSKEYLFQLTITNHIAYIAKMDGCTASDLESIRVEKRYGSLTMMRVLSWLEFFDESKSCKQHSMEMRLDLASVARKENNFKLCKKELEIFYRDCNFARMLNCEQKDLNVDNIREKLMDSDQDIWEESVSRAVYEQCKWLYCQQNRKQDAINFASVAAVRINERIAGSDEHLTGSLRDREARFLLTIADWLQNEDVRILQESSGSPLINLISSLPEVMPSADSRMISVFSAMDIVMGKLLQASVHRCPELAKAWSQFGSWCYRWGKKIMEFNTEGNTVHRINLEEIRKILPATSSDDLQKIAVILNQHEVICEEDEIGLNETSSTDLLEALQATVPDLCHCSPEKLQSIVDIWRQTHRTVYGYYETAATAYFRFLHLSSSIEMESENGNSTTVTATLRLLRLIVKHALGLKEVLEEGLAATPTNPWRVITPQLFSRLNHHEPYVRKRVSELLCRVAKDAPHLIIFPAVVGSVQEGKMDIADISIEDLDSVDQRNSICDNSGLVFCFNSLLDILSKDAPETVKQVQVLVHELRRICLLWDELWVMSLQQIYSEYTKRFASFENEVQKAVENKQLAQKNQLLAEKHNLLLRPLIFALEQLHDMTSRTPETTHEKHFQDKYSKYISAMIEKLKEPLDFNKPIEGWVRFKALYVQLQQRSQKRIAFSLRLSDISPVLAKLFNTTISMPGIDSSEKQQILIRSVDNLVQILPTKTKPKKLMFYGNNGRRYSYLFKGLEDLHLDERIMQFLSIANLMMTKSIDCNGNITYYRAEHYSVIPLGPRSGLINWVDNTIPIFSLYKKWQQREAQQKKDKPGSVCRPSELFYQKLTSVLRAHRIKFSDNRKDWPLSALKEVLQELQSETPRDLLAKELWCHSTTASAWRQVIRNYSLSVAVMSVIGYIIGLGDRHLDNMLVKLATGEIVHIDYNVCFEKGKTLRVPEKVPFRMTANLEEALGITGIEGTFRLACEHVLKSLKKGRETLLTLLEAFVYDPLVDWAVSEEAGAATFSVSTYDNREGFNSELYLAKKQLEREVNRDTLAIRFSEIKTEWIRNRDNMYQQLSLIQVFLLELENNRIELRDAEKQRDSLSRQIQMIREAESLDSAIGSHPLNTLSQRYSVFKGLVETHASTKKALMSKISECEKKIDEYRSFRKDIDSEKLHEYTAGIDTNAIECSSSEFELVQEFLESSNLRDTFLKTNTCRHEFNEYSHQTMVLVKHVFETLSQYGEIIKYFPNDFELNHRDHMYAAWCRTLIDNNTQDSCQEVMRNYQQYLTKLQQHSPGQQVLSFSFQLTNFISDSTFRLSELLSYHTQELNECTIPIDQLYENAHSTINAMALGNLNGRYLLTGAALKPYEDLSQTYLLMEQAASAAGDTLVDMQFNGDWFLYEFYTGLSQLHTLSQICFEDDNCCIPKDSFSVGMHCLSCCVGIYEQLHNMHECITQSFLTDTLRGIISENQSVIEMISAVSDLQNNVVPLSEILNDLNMHLQCVVMNVPSPHAEVMVTVESLRRRIAALGERYRLQETPTEGGSLYLKLHSLFSDLIDKRSELIQAMCDGLMASDDTDCIDQVKDAKDLTVLILNKATNDVLEAIFILKRIQTIIEFFTSCLQMACAFNGTSLAAICNDDALVRPVRKFIADFTYHLLLGIGSIAAGMVMYGVLQRSNPQLTHDIANLQQITNANRIHMNDLSNMFLERMFAEVTEIDYNKTNNACLHLSFTWKKMMHIKLLSERIMTEQISLSRWQKLFVAHSWMHNVTTIPNVGNMQQGDLTLYANRSTLLMQLKSYVESLTSAKSTIQKMRDEILNNTSAILHRLKWAAGANAELVPLLSSFEQASLKKRDFLDEQMIHLDIALKHCCSVLSYDIVRLHMHRDLEQDQEFVDLVERFRKACTKLNSCSTMVSPTEIALVELLDPEGQIDHIWLSNVKALIDDMTDQVQNKIAKVEKEVRAAQDNLHMSAHKLRTLVSTHHVLAADIKGLLKTKLKIECSPTLREYLLKYKSFLETISELHSNMLSKDFTDEWVQQAMEQVQNTLPSVHQTFDQLFEFEQSRDDDVAINAEKEMHDKIGMPIVDSPAKKLTSEGGTNKVQQTPKEQKRNAYAVSVWRRIRMKLEGRDPDPNRRCTAQEQVDWMIREAMEPDNLAVLYEGWTPWV
ncbi:serine/threonine-protein kinase Smg1 [Toxorhynchites rutilus septentrionalis]|uniref:serine/threonine-protein kinase Smg1 n=1 Tax=Toxorhynchites rutilus septentrionalis TaxID=329112 RepID=UPI0024799B98|nr:serine/threonine-protein kinase Smg1 [Toxorhynchites rutilus septentrionalis]